VTLEARALRRKSCNIAVKLEFMMWASVIASALATTLGVLLPHHGELIVTVLLLVFFTDLWFAGDPECKE